MLPAVHASQQASLRKKPVRREQSNRTTEPALRTDSVEVMPTFRGGGIEEFQVWMTSMLRYPKELMEREQSGHVMLEFAVETDGRPVVDRVVYSSNPLFTEEVMRVMKLSPHWTPGRNAEGDTVRVKYSLPVDFHCLDGDGWNGNGDYRYKIKQGF